MRYVSFSCPFGEGGGGEVERWSGAIPCDLTGIRNTCCGGGDPLDMDMTSHCCCIGVYGANCQYFNSLAREVQC